MNELTIPYMLWFSQYFSVSYTRLAMIRTLNKPGFSNVSLARREREHVREHRFQSLLVKAGRMQDDQRHRCIVAIECAGMIKVRMWVAVCQDVEGVVGVRRKN